ncbi:hypothetical protein L3C95_18400 [Chitinophaga filiformis]|uniref:hypothetical protein n=1 Tax=Chitinophaga filiformis TaxID=104663 RepID=UPI001F2B3A2E|nr:hypothetical protein [Chitinophaga filiformis]MCF6404877.1 hypothetical protein [Chitinophaga filiformis]
MTSSKEIRTALPQQNQRPAAEEIGNNALSYPAVTAFPVLQAAGTNSSIPIRQAAAALSSHTAVVQRRVGVEVETGIPVYKPYTGTTYGNDANLLGLCFNGSSYSRTTRGDVNGVELHADSGGNVYSVAGRYYEENIKNRVKGVPDKPGKSGIVEFVTSEAGLVDELEPTNGKQNLINHLNEIQTQIGQMEQTGPHVVGTAGYRAGVSYTWPWGDEFKDAMKTNGYSPQVNIGIDLGGLAGLFAQPIGRTLTNGFFWGIGEAQNTHAEIAALMSKIRTLPIEQAKDAAPIMPGNRLLNSLEGVLNVLLMYFKGAAAGHNTKETEKNEVPYMLKGSFQALWKELLEQFPEEQRNTDPRKWFKRIESLIETIDDKYRLQASLASKMDNHVTVSSAFRTLVDGGDIATSIASGEKLDNDEDSEINNQVRDNFPELMADANRSVPIVEIRHMATVGNPAGVQENVMQVVEEILDRQLVQFGNAAATIKANAGW